MALDAPHSGAFGFNPGDNSDRLHGFVGHAVSGTQSDGDFFCIRPDLRLADGHTLFSGTGPCTADDQDSFA